MGYYTAFSLNLPDGVEEEELCKALGETQFLSGNVQYCKNLLYGCFIAEWYNNALDMEELSKKFPNKLFILEGKGEDGDDIWKKYFKNGKSYFEKAQIIFKDFDESKLE